MTFLAAAPTAAILFHPQPSSVTPSVIVGTEGAGIAGAPSPVDRMAPNSGDVLDVRPVRQARVQRQSIRALCAASGSPRHLIYRHHRRREGVGYRTALLDSLNDTQSGAAGVVASAVPTLTPTRLAGERTHEFGHQKGMQMGKAYPLGRTLEDVVMDYRIGKQHGLAPKALLAIVDPIFEAALPDMLATVAYVGTCLTSQQGMFGSWATRQWRGLQQARSGIDFPALDEGDGQ